MTYLLDTDILSDRMKPRPSATLAARLAVVPSGDIATSSITLGELLFGALRNASARLDLVEKIETFISQPLPILPFDEPAARQYGRVRAELERRGTPLADPDLRIACIALAQGLAVVTGNVRHFAKVPGLRVENWFE